MIYRYASLEGPSWALATLPRDASRVNVAPDSWIDVEHLARVIAARALRPYHPLATEPTP